MSSTKLGILYVENFDKSLFKAFTKWYKGLFKYDTLLFLFLSVNNNWKGKG